MKSVEADGVKERPLALLFKLLQKLVDLVLHVVRVLDLRNNESRVKKLLMETAIFMHGYVTTYCILDFKDDIRMIICFMKPTEWTCKILVKINTLKCENLRIIHKT